MESARPTRETRAVSVQSKVARRVEVEWAKSSDMFFVGADLCVRPSLNGGAAGRTHGSAPTDLLMRGNFVGDQWLQLLWRERFKRPLAAVHKNRRRSVHSQRMRAFSVEEDAAFDCLVIVVAPKLFHVEPDPGRVAFKDRTHVKRLMPILLVFVNHVVHFPKLTLQSCGFGGAGGGKGMRVSRHERIFAENHAQLRWPKLRLHLFQNRMQQATRRTLKITKLLERDRRRGITLSVRRLGAGLFHVGRVS